MLQINKGSGSFGEDGDFSTEDRNFPPDVSRPPETDRAKWDREGGSPFPREPYLRRQVYSMSESVLYLSYCSAIFSPVATTGSGF
jgi:hypothetical protein